MTQDQSYRADTHGLPLVDQAPPMPKVAAPLDQPTSTAIPCRGLVLNVPSFFVDHDFVAWLNDGNPKFTWHKGGSPAEWSDVVVLVDPGLSGEGSEDGTMPDRFWAQIVEACRAAFEPEQGAHHIMVRLTNLD